MTRLAYPISVRELKQTLNFSVLMEERSRIGHLNVKNLNLEVSKPVATFAEELNIDILIRLGSDSGNLVIPNSR